MTNFTLLMNEKFKKQFFDWFYKTLNRNLKDNVRNFKIAEW